MSYTRLPCPNWVEYSEDKMLRSRKYFPLIGWIVGLWSVLSFLIFYKVFPLSLSIVLSIVFSVLVTGAFHEDGLADTCDAFGGGWKKDQILDIMKDSRLGTYGVTGLFLILLTKFIVLVELGKISIPLLSVTYLNAHVNSRFIALTFMRSHDYVQDLEKSKVKSVTTQKLTIGQLCFAFLFVLPAWLLFGAHYLLLLAFPIAYAMKVYLGWYFKKRIGGYTGDCLGATQQLAECSFYLGVLGIYGLT